MTIIYSFLFCGLVCLIAQIIFENSNLTFGHITSLFVIIGSILSLFGIYDKIVNVVGAGANLPIISFGNLLTNGAYNGFLEKGFLGLFTGMLQNVSLGVVSAVVFSFLITFFTKPRD